MVGHLKSLFGPKILPPKETVCGEFKESENSLVALISQLERIPSGKWKRLPASTQSVSRFRKTGTKVIQEAELGLDGSVIRLVKESFIFIDEHGCVNNTKYCLEKGETGSSYSVETGDYEAGGNRLKRKVEQSYPENANRIISLGNSIINPS